MQYYDSILNARSQQALKQKLREMREKYITQDKQLEEDKILHDTSNVSGRERPWRRHKMANELLAKAYDEVNTSKAERLRDCSRLLSFKVFPSGNKVLKSMNSCRVRLCPICTWRRSLKVYYNTLKIVDFLNEHRQLNYIFLTLTVRNCTADKLCETIDDIMTAWDRLMRLSTVKTAVKGWMRSMEITHNIDRNSESYDTFHPHFHCLLAVNPSYFTSRDYISQATWTDIWQQSLRVDYVPVVDVRRCYGTDAHAVSECAKYSCKTDDFVIADDWDLTVKTVKILDEALDRRRLVAYGGAMREAHKLLNLDEEADGDLVNVGEENADEGNDYIIETYCWYSGYRQYGRI